MSTNEARSAVSRRKYLFEPVFGIIEEQQGVRRFLLRGLDNVAADWTLLSTAFNLRTLPVLVAREAAYIQTGQFSPDGPSGFLIVSGPLREHDQVQVRLLVPPAGNAGDAQNDRLDGGVLRQVLGQGSSPRDTRAR